GQSAAPRAPQPGEREQPPGKGEPPALPFRPREPGRTTGAAWGKSLKVSADRSAARCCLTEGSCRGGGWCWSSCPLSPCGGSGNSSAPATCPQPRSRQ